MLEIKLAGMLFALVHLSNSSTVVDHTGTNFLLERGFMSFAIPPSDPSAITGAHYRPNRITGDHQTSLPARQGLGILIVDEDSYVRAALHAGLTHMGFRVCVAASGREAIDCYRQCHADIALVLLDVEMPTLDGQDIVAFLRQINPSVKSCFMTSRLPRQHQVKPGETPVFLKPFNVFRSAGVLRDLAGFSGN